MDLFLSILTEHITLISVAYLVAGVILGILGGSLPGISSSMTISLILPMSLYFETSNALMLLICSYQGALYGRSISSILINTPGTPAAAASVLDGYPMTQQGKAGKALNTALYASVVGDSVSVLILCCMSVPWAYVASLF